MCPNDTQGATALCCPLTRDLASRSRLMEHFSVIRQYDPRPKNQDGSVRWFLYRWDDGKSGMRKLVRCRHCGSLFLVQAYRVNKFPSLPQSGLRTGIPSKAKPRPTKSTVPSRGRSGNCVTNLFYAVQMIKSHSSDEFRPSCAGNLPAHAACRKSLFAPLRAVFRTLKSSKNLLFERAGGFLPPAHIPRCSVTAHFSIVYRQSACTGNLPAHFFVLSACLRIPALLLFPLPYKTNTFLCKSSLSNELDFL